MDPNPEPIAPPARSPARAPGRIGGGWSSGLVAGLIGLVVGAGGVAAYHILFPPGRGQTEALVRDYILAHGEILPEAMERLRAREAAQVIRQNRIALETPFRSAWAGASDGDVVLVEFFDYACVYCRASNPHVARLLREDPRLKVVWREYPVLGPDSEQAAISSLTAAEAGRFRHFHDLLFATARPTAAAIASARQSAGIGTPALSDAFRRELQGNFQLARAIGASGTPTFVIGDRVLQGAVGYEALKRAISEARQ
jgi:protein-disulfide isomerase